MKKQQKRSQFDSAFGNRVSQDGFHKGRPFWLPVISYYFLSIAVSLTLFFLIWAILLESGEPAPYIPAGIVAGMLLIVLFVIREILLRRIRMQRLMEQRQLDLNLDSIAVNVGNLSPKLSIRRNAELLGNIKQKSDSAFLLKRIPEAHWEAFWLCDEYLNITRKEMTRTHVNSPRFRPINKGRGKVRKLHRLHLLNWAELASSSLALGSNDPNATFESRIEQAETAAAALERALGFYPRETKLGESLEAVKEYIASVEISRLIARAENLNVEGNSYQAIRVYNEALSELDSAELRNREKTLVADNIRFEISRIESGKNRKDS